MNSEREHDAGESARRHDGTDDPSLYINREMSWLDFNDRVLQLAEDEHVPLLERVKFCAIYTTNLDEYYMVRVAGLRDQIDAGVENPSQDGLIAHFRTIAAETDRCVLIYNIPYRTAVNLSNDSMLELAQVPNIVGAKDSSGSIAQSLDLLQRKPADFSVLTGEDALHFTMMANGAEGGILAASHLMTQGFVDVTRAFQRGDLAAARAAWAPLASLVPLLFAEANPMPIKYCLWRQGLIASPECRLPLTKISDGLARQLDAAIAPSADRGSLSAGPLPSRVAPAVAE